MGEFALWAAELRDAFIAVPRPVLAVLAASGAVGIALAALRVENRGSIAPTLITNGIIGTIGLTSPTAWAAISTFNGWAVAIITPAAAGIGGALALFVLVATLIERSRRNDGEIALRQLLELRRRMAEAGPGNSQEIR